ncbi:hypothetical protein ACNKHK_16660 [Shigella flexneri]
MAWPIACTIWEGGSGHRFVVDANGQMVFSESRTTMRMWWAETTWQMQRLRDNPECADQEHDAKTNDADPGLNVKLTFDINDDVAAPYIATGARPKVAVLREQGVNSTLRWRQLSTVRALTPSMYT